MVGLNWNIFRSKFHLRERAAFESLAYMLFCYEHGIKVGIFRFKNQTGIETEPILYQEKLTGFQAKYYETKLSSNKDDIIDSLRKAKSKNPNLQKILLYANQELSESRDKTKKKPAYQLAIEKVAAELDFELEWRVNSHIEKQLSAPENDYLVSYFFETRTGIIDFLEQLKQHSTHILYAIHTDIAFADGTIKIERAVAVSSLHKSSSQVIILAGEGGSGKTALIKDSWPYNKPCYILKAAEFNRTSISEVLSQFGRFGLSDLIRAHNEEPEKIFVIDSAEKLADLESQDVFIEFLSALIANQWKIIFTTRLSYLDDLRFQMIEIYRQPFETITLGNITAEELEELSRQFKFGLPADHRLLQILGNLFYLKEYLALYDTINDQIDFAKFRNILWQKRIQHSSFKKNNAHLEREKCFLQLAKKRCDSGNFFVTDPPCDSSILSLLVQDEIIQYEDSQSGYFITHDIYEEWALEKLIEKEFARVTSSANFFEQIGSSLPMRRAFRSWLSGKLSQADPGTKLFIEQAFTESAIPSFWKDELLISILLSDYCGWFFTSFEQSLLEQKGYYLKRIVFLLRTACKAVDSALQKIMQATQTSINPAYVFTKPKGKGWEVAIAFLHDRISSVKKDDLDIYLPLLKEWVNQHPTGNTTRLSGLFALHFYKDAELNDGSYYRTEIEKLLLQITLAAARELKKELTDIVQDLLKSSFNRRDAFDSLRDTVLTSNNESLPFIVTLPELTIQLANQAWYGPASDRHPFAGSIGVEQYYDIRDHNYHPASALQTPIYYLLLVAFPQTIQFILDFTNRATAAYAKSEYGDTVMEITLLVDGVESKQLISHSLWSMYRAVGSPITPYLLQSMHMALEKFLLEKAKESKGKNLVPWLKHLLKHTRSASITAVVTSVVLAHPDSFFEVAAILFSQYEFYRYDNIRQGEEHHALSLYSIGRGFNRQSKAYEDERIASCDDPHRKKSLESLVVEYQFFRNEGVSEEEAIKRSEAIENVIDQMHASLDPATLSTEKGKAMRLLLTRIDRRKMSPTVQHEKNQSIILLNPELDAELKTYSEEGTKQYTDKFKYSRLKAWGISKFDRRMQDKSYPQYEEHPNIVLKETKEIVDQFKNATQEFFLFNGEIPAYTCAALLKLHSKELSRKDLKYCKDVIIQYALRPLQPGYDYQIGDGVEVAISTLPYLYALFPKGRKDYNLILLFTLFDEYPIGEYKRISDYAIEAINPNLFQWQPADANSILLAYLGFKPSFDKLTDPRKLHQSGVTRHQVLEQFAETHDQELRNLKVSYDYYKTIDFDQLSIDIVDIAFLLMPDATEDNIHLDFTRKALEAYSNGLLAETRYDDNEKINYRLKNRFFRKYARFLLHRPDVSVAAWVQPFIDHFTISESMAQFISDVVSEQDRLQQYDNFWAIWESLYPTIKKAALASRYRNMDSILHNYLLAWPWWNDTAKEWHSLRRKDSAFFKKICQNMGAHPAVLYSIAKLLNEIGASFSDEGLIWIADLFTQHKKLSAADVHPNTIYYLEIIARRFVYLNWTNIKRNLLLKGKVLTLLDYLVSKGSVNGYLLREEVF